MRLGLGPGLALLSAVLFGASTPLAKLLLDQIDPWMLAGLLYLGSGVGLTIVRVVSRSVWRGAPREAALRGGEWGWLALAVVAGGGIGPVLLMVGLARSAATTAALLLNLEGVFTAVLAWFVFRENFDRRIALGMAVISAGALVLSWHGGAALDDALGPLAVAAGSCGRPASEYGRLNETASRWRISEEVGSVVGRWYRRSACGPSGPGAASGKHRS